MPERIVSREEDKCRGPDGRFFISVKVMKNTIEYENGSRELVLKCPIGRLNENQSYNCTKSDKLCPFLAVKYFIK